MRSMAMVSHTQAVTTITPPASAHGDRSSWDFAVPLDHENPLYDRKGYMANDVSAKSYAPRHPLTQQANGYARGAQRRTDTLDSQRSGRSGHVDANLAPSRVDAYGRKTSGHSEADSLLDQHKNGDSRRDTVSAEPDQMDGVERNDAYWIHRDKLAQIERHELEEAGFLPRNSARSGSRSSSKSRASRRKRDTSSSRDGAHYAPAEEYNARMVSPIPAEDEPDERPQSNIVTDWRTPEEINAERENFAARKDVPRPGTSRIPIPKHTAVPIPAEHVEREAPLPRSRSGSQVLGTSPGPDAIAFPRRRRGGSVGSQVLLDDASDPGSSIDGDASKKNSPKGSGTASPAKAKMPSNKTPNSTKRAQSKPRTASSTQNKSRTNSGTRPRTASRPATSHNRPEGEAPWIATMYKPDPRLPPDQQMLPTHAKRIAQEQWEKDGKVGNIYDKDFKLLNEYDYSAKRRSNGSMSPTYQDPVPELPPPQAEQESESRDQRQEKQEEPNNSWPLENTGKDSQDAQQQSPATEHAGFKLTPSVPAPMPTHTATVTAQHSPRPDTIRVPDLGEKEDEKPKKSACCCVVM